MIKFDKNKDKIAIIAPASGLVDKDMKFDLETTKKRLEVLEASLNESLRAQRSNPSIIVDCRVGPDGSPRNDDLPEFFITPRQHRLKELKEAIENPEVKIIFAFRGGYGSTEILFDCLDIKPSGPKILVGFSDITALHFLFNQHYGFPSIHGTMDASKKDAFGQVIDVLAGKEMSLNLEPLNAAAEADSLIDGQMVGGNLNLICNMLGTKLHPETKDKILFLEDVEEKGYQVHRHLVHLKNAGLLDSIKALILGEFTNSDNQLEVSLVHFVSEHMSNIPVFRTNEIGHGKLNVPITIGGQGSISENELKVKSEFRVV